MHASLKQTSKKRFYISFIKIKILYKNKKLMLKLSFKNSEKKINILQYEQGYQ